MVMPGVDIPPLRADAPQPSFSASSRATDAPFFRTWIAADIPVSSPPITATSIVSGRVDCVVDAFRGRVDPVRPGLERRTLPRWPLDDGGHQAPKRPGSSAIEEISR